MARSFGERGAARLPNSSEIVAYFEALLVFGFEAKIQPFERGRDDAAAPWQSAVAN